MSERTKHSSGNNLSTRIREHLRTKKGKTVAGVGGVAVLAGTAIGVGVNVANGEEPRPETSVTLAPEEPVAAEQTEEPSPTAIPGLAEPTETASPSPSETTTEAGSFQEELEAQLGSVESPIPADFFRELIDQDEVAAFQQLHPEDFHNATQGGKFAEALQNATAANIQERLQEQATFYDDPHITALIEAPFTRSLEEFKSSGDVPLSLTVLVNSFEYGTFNASYCMMSGECGDHDPLTPVELMFANKNDSFAELVKDTVAQDAMEGVETSPWVSYDRQIMDVKVTPENVTIILLYSEARNNDGTSTELLEWYTVVKPLSEHMLSLNPEGATSFLASSLEVEADS